MVGVFFIFYNSDIDCVKVVHPLIPASLLQLGTMIPVQRDMMRAKPTKRPASASAVDLHNAYRERAKENSGGTKEAQDLAYVDKVAPTGKELLEQIKAGDRSALNGLQYAGNGQVYEDGDFLRGKRKHAVVNINPNIDEAYLAHELGHSASTNSKVGDKVRRLRDFLGSNPKAATAMLAATGLTPIVAGAMTPGDDDLDEAILGAIALDSPKLIDEALATKNAIEIMKKAGRPPTMGQYGRLAGAYLTYLAAPIAAGTFGNFLGNQLD